MSIPLAIHPWPVAREDQLAISAALEVLGNPDVIPSPAVPGTPTRILALREAPNFLHEGVALVGDPSKRDSLVGALRIVLSDADDPRLITILDSLRAIFGPNVREVSVHFE